jgi:hypothetical protein
MWILVGKVSTRDDREDRGHDEGNPLFFDTLPGIKRNW